MQPADVQAAVRRWLPADRRFELSIVPGQAVSAAHENRSSSLIAAFVLTAPAGARQAPDRSKAPAPGPAPALKLPPIEKRTLTNGLPVWIVEMHEVPVVDVSVVVKSGAAADPAGKYGLASFTAAMLDEGAGKCNALDLADAVEFLGASLTTGSSFDSSVMNLHTPVSKLDEALPLLADVALRPTFPQNEIDRMRKERLTSLLQTRDNPAAVAAAGFARLALRRRPSLRHADDGHRVVEHRDDGRRAATVSTRRTTSRRTPT